MRLRATIVAAALSFCSQTAHAAAQGDCLAHYYETKSSICVDELIAKLGQGSVVSDGKNGLGNPAATGFLAQLFKQNPDEKQRLLRAENSLRLRELFTAALYLARLREEAGAYAVSANVEGVYEWYNRQHMPAIADLGPGADPRINDLLIGAYMASGDTTLVRPLLESIKSVDKNMAADAFRMSLFISKFGQNMTSQGRPNYMIEAACLKYECKPNPSKFLRLITIASGLWALQNLSKDDVQLAALTSQFFTSDINSDLKTALEAERVGFQNYLVGLVSFAVIRNDVNLEQSLSIYEKLGPVQEAFAAFEKMTKEKSFESKVDAAPKP